MEINWNDFDADSKKLAKELVEDSKKFENLIKKLQKSKSEVSLETKLDKALSEDIKQ